MFRDRMNYWRWHDKQRPTCKLAISAYERIRITQEKFCAAFVYRALRPRYLNLFESSDASVEQNLFALEFKKNLLIYERYLFKLLLFLKIKLLLFLQTKLILAKS